MLRARGSFWVASLMAVFVATTAAQSAGTVGFDQGALAGELSTMNDRLKSGGRSPHEVVADAERLGSAYRSMRPAARRFSAADQALNRRLAGQSFGWLTRARAMYPRNAAVQAQLMHAYGSMGAFYGDVGGFYPAGAFTAYGGASRLARLLVLNGASGSLFEQDLERYALAYATAAYAYGTIFDWWAQPTVDQEPRTLSPGQVPPTPAPVVLPHVDEGSLSVDQQAQWRDVQDRFRSTAPRVHEARLRMNDLTIRLAHQRLTVNLTDAATAAKMQGFLEDAVDLVKSQQFELASQALIRASYERAKLKNVIGQ